MGLCTSKQSARDTQALEMGREASSSNGVEANRGQIVVDNPSPPSSSSSKPSSPKLEDTQRRRLSVSTVQVHEDVPPAPPIRGVTSLEGLRLEEKDAIKKVDKTLEDTSSNHHSVRSKIKKFADPALELLNEKSGSIRDVTVDMILDLVSQSDKTYMVFGSPSGEVQRGFDVSNIRDLGHQAH